MTLDRVQPRDFQCQEYFSLLLLDGIELQIQLHPGQQPRNRTTQVGAYRRQR